MTRDDIIRMAREAGFYAYKKDLFWAGSEGLELFASIVAAAEREACAQIVEKTAAAWRNNELLRGVLMGNAAAIRARGES